MDMTFAGKVFAIEMVLRGYMTTTALQTDDPVACLKQWQHDIKSTLQNAEREVSEEADELWSHAVVEIDTLFSNVEIRVLDQMSRLSK